MLIIEKDLIKQLVGMNEAIETIENAFRAFYRGNVRTPLRQNISVPDDNGNALYMPCLIEKPEKLKTLGVKIVTVYENNPDQGLPTIFATYLLNDPETGELLSILEASYLTGLRTAAVTGLAIEHLARPDANLLGIIGSGYQAYYQALASNQVRDLDEIKLFDKDRSQAQELKAKLNEEVKPEVTIAESADKLAKNSEIIITVTSSDEPVFPGEALNQGDTIIAVGAYKPDMREVDSITIERANIWVDSLEASLEEAGDLVIPIEEGTLEKSDIMGELGGVIEGDTPARSNKEEITFFESVGLAFEDAAIARAAYDQAVEAQKGTQVHF